MILLVKLSLITRLPIVKKGEASKVGLKVEIMTEQYDNRTPPALKYSKRSQLLGSTVPGFVIELIVNENWEDVVALENKFEAFIIFAELIQVIPTSPVQPE